MLIDIVFPKGNEDEFIAMAQKLGYKGICFAYELKSSEKAKNYAKRKAKINVFSAVVIRPSETAKAKKKADLVMCYCKENARQAIEGGADIVFGMEEAEKKDYMHQRNAGLNQVLLGIAKQKEVSPGFMFSKVFEAKNKPAYLGRIMQNIALCKKYKATMIIASFAQTPLQMRNPKDLECFFSGLGISRTEARKAQQNVFYLIDKNIRKSKGEMLPGDVEVVDA